MSSNTPEGDAAASSSHEESKGEGGEGQPQDTQFVNEGESSPVQCALSGNVALVSHPLILANYFLIYSRQLLLRNRPPIMGTKQDTMAGTSESLLWKPHWKRDGRWQKRHRFHGTTGGSAHRSG